MDNIANIHLAASTSSEKNYGSQEQMQNQFIAANPTKGKPPMVQRSKDSQQSTEQTFDNRQG